MIIRQAKPDRRSKRGQTAKRPTSAFPCTGEQFQFARFQAHRNPNAE
jgi:hypothetical protein